MLIGGGFEEVVDVGDYVPGCYVAGVESGEIVRLDVGDAGAVRFRVSTSLYS